jgi:hypothetical protein
LNDVHFIHLGLDFGLPARPVLQRLELAFGIGSFGSEKSKKFWLLTIGSFKLYINARVSGCQRSMLCGVSEPEKLPFENMYT